MWIGLRTLPLVAAVTLTAAAAAQKPTPSLDDLLQRAVAEQTAGDFSSAIHDYRAVLARRPEQLEARVNLGAALAHTGQFDAAIEQYRIALAAAPPDEGLRNNLELNIALALYKKGDLPAARQALEPLQARSPQEARLATLLGDADTRLGDPAAAVALMAPLAAANEANSDFDFVYGSALIRDGSRRQGAELVERVAEQGHSADAYMLAGSTLLAINEFERARKDLEKALTLDPKLAGLHSLVAQARDRTGAADAAEPEFRLALKENPDDFNANLYLGTILLKRRSLAESKPFLDKAVALDPKSSMARYESAMLAGTSGDLASAAKTLEQITAEDPTWLEPHVELATLYYKLHQPEQGAKERAIVDKLTAAQQASGPHRE